MTKRSPFEKYQLFLELLPRVIAAIESGTKTEYILELRAFAEKAQKYIDSFPEHLKELDNTDAVKALGESLYHAIFE